MRGGVIESELLLWRSSAALLPTRGPSVHPQHLHDPAVPAETVPAQAVPAENLPAEAVLPSLHGSSVPAETQAALPAQTLLRLLAGSTAAGPELLQKVRAADAVLPGAPLSGSVLQTGSALLQTGPVL